MSDSSQYAKEAHLYSRIADQIHEQIRNGIYRTDDKLPSVRSLSRAQHVSISTALAAYGVLEDRGVIYVKPKSGYFVKRMVNRQVKPPHITQEATLPAEVSSMQRVMEVMRDSNDPVYISFGAALPSSDFPVIAQLKKNFLAEGTL